MSPEQASGLPTDHRSDIFSFGIVLYELFSGRLPFTGEFELSVLYAIINEEPAGLADTDVCLPEELEAIVMNALKKDKTERYQSMDVLLQDLDRYATSISALEH
jgi:serine/threonine-protein kinase